MADVELKDIQKTFVGGGIPALRDISLKVPDGQFATVLGPSGCGKTTLLRIVAGLEQPDRGEVRIGGRVVNKVPPSKRNIAMVFQNYALYPHKTAFDNIAIGLRLRKVSKETIKRKVDDVAQMLEIGELLKRYPKQLSGGQQQRVALARALVREPEVFLLDEPLSNLDAIIRDATRTELKKLFKELKVTVIYVTHDQTEAMTMSDFMVVMERGEIQQTGDPDTVYRDPVHRFVAEFIGPYRINLIPGKIEDRKFVSRDGTVVFEAKQENVEDALAGLRPEHIALEATGEITLKGEVVLVEPMGANRLVSVKIGKRELKVLSSKVPSPHETVAFSFTFRDVFFFEGKSGVRLRPEDPIAAGGAEPRK